MLIEWSTEECHAWRHKNASLSISFLGFSFPTSPLIPPFSDLHMTHFTTSYRFFFNSRLQEPPEYIVMLKEDCGTHKTLRNTPNLFLDTLQLHSLFDNVRQRLFACCLAASVGSSMPLPGLVHDTHSNILKCLISILKRINVPPYFLKVNWK